MIEAGATTPWWMAGSAIAGGVVLKVVEWAFTRRKNRTETDANIELIESLREGLDRQGKRIMEMEERQDRIHTRLEEEIRLRQEAQEEAHWLRVRVQVLEGALRQLGAVIPEEVPRPKRRPAT